MWIGPRCSNPFMRKSDSRFLLARDLAKIPLERLLELDRKLYLINITVEGFEQKDGGNNG
jgi:hypothetical protein